MWCHAGPCKTYRYTRALTNVLEENYCVIWVRTCYTYCINIAVIAVHAGVAGIVAASNCDGNTLTQLITNCKRGHEERRLTAYYWMIGSTIAAIFFLPFATGLCYYIVELVIIYGNDDAEKAKKEEEKKLEEVRKKDPEANNKKKIGAATNGGLESTDGITTVDPEEKVKADDLEEYHFGDVQRAKFESLTKEALVLLFLALAFFMASFVGGE